MVFIWVLNVEYPPPKKIPAASDSREASGILKVKWRASSTTHRL